MADASSDSLGGRALSSHGDKLRERRSENTAATAAAELIEAGLPDFSDDFDHAGQISLNWSWLIGGARKCLSAMAFRPLFFNEASTSDRKFDDLKNSIIKRRACQRATFQSSASEFASRSVRYCARASAQ